MPTTLDATAILKACVTVHFSLATLAMIGHWLPNGYLWSQTVIVVIGLWALSSPENVESLNLLTLANGVTIILDSITVGANWHSTANIDATGLFGFTAAMSILLIFFKIGYSFFSHRFARERAGGPSIAGGLPTFGNWNHQSQYQAPEATGP